MKRLKKFSPIIVMQNMIDRGRGYIELLKAMIHDDPEPEEPLPKDIWFLLPPTKTRSGQLSLFNDEDFE